MSVNQIGEIDTGVEKNGNVINYTDYYTKEPVSFTVAAPVGAHIQSTRSSTQGV